MYHPLFVCIIKPNIYYCVKGSENVGVPIMEDRELIEQFKNGNKQAFNLLVNKYRERVYSIVFRMLRNEDEAMDISQDVFVRVYKSLPKFRGDSSFYTWVYKIAVNLSINYINRDKHRKLEDLADYSYKMKATRGNPDKEYENTELRQAIERATLSLPKKQRAIFVMRHYENLSHKEIAEITGKSVGSVKANYHHALQKLKEQLADFV